MWIFYRAMDLQNSLHDSAMERRADTGDPRDRHAEDLYSWPTANGRKVHIVLEEMGLSNDAHGVHIGKGKQFAPTFLKISPNNGETATDDRSRTGNPVWQQAIWPALS